ncbi:MAG: VOC family protein [Candidatus Acidiferrales bacterium]
MQLTPYLYFNGQCEEAFKFYERTLGAKIDTVFRYGGTPAAETVPQDWRDKVLHARLILEGNELNAADVLPEQYLKPQGFHVAVQFKDVQAGKRVFNALSENGTVQYAFQPTFWTPGFGLVVDRFGIPWMINCEQPT